MGFQPLVFPCHFEPELTALIAYLTVVCRMPRRVVQELLGQVLGIPLSLGSIQNSWEEASEAVAEPCTELEMQLAHEPVINSDETGYRTSGDKRWLWALGAVNFVFYKIALTRGAEVLVQLFGEVFSGILCSDRCASYLKYHKGEGQFCWAHFKRNILGIQEIGKTTDAERFCRDALALHARLFWVWHRFRGGPGVRYGPVTREQLIAKSIPLEKKFFALADRYADSCIKTYATLPLRCSNTLRSSSPFCATKAWSPPTTPPRERSSALCSGARSASAVAVHKAKLQLARLLMVTRTCRIQNREPLDYLGNAIRSHRKAQAASSLLKAPSTT
jgi:transposase